MNLQLRRPLVIFDLETTGISVSRDRIVEICLLKVYPDGREEIRTYRVNPECPIPAEASAVHGIYDSDVADKPTFRELAAEIHEFIKDSDFGGFNSNKFDFPMLVEEFYRVGVAFEIQKRKFVDAQRIFHQKEPRNLKAALKFYCDMDLENAHSAEADTVATWQIIKAQLERYSDLPKDLDALHEQFGQSNLADLAGRFVVDPAGVVVFNFGKHRGRPVKDVLKNEPSYYNWMMEGDFPQDTKNVLTRIRLAMREGQ